MSFPLSLTSASLQFSVNSLFSVDAVRHPWYLYRLATLNIGITMCTIQKACLISTLEILISDIRCTSQLRHSFDIRNQLFCEVSSAHF